MWKNRLLWLICLAAAFVLYVCCESWICWYLLVLVFFLPLVSLLCSLPFSAGKTVEEHHVGRIRRGEDCRVVLIIPGRSGSPLGCSVTLRVRDLMSGSCRTEKLRLYSGEEAYFELDTAHCGRYEIEMPRAVYADFLGIFALRCKRPENFFVSVDPVPVMPDPEPDFSRFVPMRFFPKRGGGFAENHELREYTPGDPLSTIHWKLSAKTDKTIVREPQDQEQSRVYLTLDLTRDRREMDEALGSLAWIAGRLFSLGITFTVCYLKDSVDSVCSFKPADKRELNALLDDIMSTVPKNGLPSLSGRDMPGATWRYHLNPGKEESND